MTSLPSSPLRLADLPNRKATRFDLNPEPQALTEMAETLEIKGLRKFRFYGELRPKGRQDWELKATLATTAIQDCVVTLAPVITRIDTAVERHYLAHYAVPEGSEVEMPDDTADEPLPDVIDLYDIALEELALALPAFPRADGAELGHANYAAPGVTPMTDEDAKPFAGLAGLKTALEKDGNKG